jgi:PKD repeat protein
MAASSSPSFGARSCFLPPCTGIETPAFSYQHDDPRFCYPLNPNGTCNLAQSSITIGPVYRGATFPAEYTGNLFFGDYATRGLWRVVFDANDAVDTVEPFDTRPDAGTVVDLAVGPDGALYTLTFGLTPQLEPEPAALYRIAWIGTGNAHPIVRAQATPTAGIVPLEVAFTSSNTTDPDAGPEALRFHWEFGDGSESTEPNPSHVYTQPGPYRVHLQVTDGAAVVRSTAINIRVGGPPAGNITKPALGTRYRAGDIVQFEGTANDPDGELDAGAFTWEIVLLHAGHSHPFVGPTTGITSGTFDAPRTGHDPEDTSYQVRLTVTDPTGLTSTSTRALLPSFVAVTLDTVPSGISVFLDGAPVSTPRNRNSLVGFEHTLSAPATFEVDGITYRFSSWSDGAERDRQLITSDRDIAVTAVYAPDLPTTTTTIDESTSTTSTTDSAPTTTVTTTSEPSTTTDAPTTSTLPVCPGSCDDGDACTDDVCAGGQCVHLRRSGVEGLQCVCTTTPAACRQELLADTLINPRNAACRSVARLSETLSPRGALLRAKSVRRYARRGILRLRAYLRTDTTSSACAAALRDDLERLDSGARALSADLR